MITIKTNKLWLMAGAILLAAAAFFIPAEAFAQLQTQSLQEQQVDISKNIAGIPKLIALGSYIIGAFFAVRALFALKGFIEAPDDNPITKVIGFGAVSALLILLPYIIGVMATSIGAENIDVNSASSSFQSQFDNE